MDPSSYCGSYPQQPGARPYKDMRVWPILVLVIIVIMYWSPRMGGGRAALITVITAVLTASAEETVRALALPFEVRTV
jgi:Flp pilus assembly protein protease CpaA